MLQLNVSYIIASKETSAVMIMTTSYVLNFAAVTMTTHYNLIYKLYVLQIPLYHQQDALLLLDNNGDNYNTTPSDINDTITTFIMQIYSSPLSYRSLYTETSILERLVEK